ncbi:hypothetical protein D8Y22_13300 [Salinadaptatus halalkaliphilus]|uniref:Uncharacterized protein n=1 Tax=Salinadaptatus halalkaliphilus TaxID=2419781 RepID=A0A4S3TJX4_9EURY|nr:hypothetical protein [Salinadaptatus halalkaliphilus]THE64382.1 hypothetical protein D8Y22_13300 [Salinadaptatus halalkaliphilus]
MTGNSPRPRTVSLASDDRARIPFAMIAVLLLVTSVVTIGALEQRSAPVIEQEADLVADRTETAAQAELRSAAIDASHQAVSAPVINASESEIDAIDDRQDQPVNFEQYLKLLIYLEAHDRLPAAGQSLGPDASSTVSMPDVTKHGDGATLSPDDAIDRVDLTIGDRPGTELEPGLVEVTIRDVEIDVDVAGDPVPAASNEVTTTIGTPAFQLNERTQTYESTLDAGFFDESGDELDNELDGLGQRMAARLYAFAYFKAGWDRMHRTQRPADHDFERVLEPNHTEVLANHAIFATQEDVFGTQDPYAERTLRPGYTCMAYQMGESMRDDDDDGAVGGDDGAGDDIVDGDEFGMDDDVEDTEENESIDIEAQLCDGGAVQKWLFGDEATGELPEMPELSELIQEGLGEMDVMNQQQEVPIETLAGVSYQYYDVQTHGDSVDEEALFEESTADLLDVAEGEGKERYDDEIDPGDTPSLQNDGRSIQRIADELYTVDIDTTGGDASIAGQVPSAGSPPSGNHSLDSFDVEMTDITAIEVDHEAYPDPDDPSTTDTHDRPIHHVDARADIEIYAVETWEHDEPDNAAKYGELPETKTEDHNETVTADLSLEVTSEYDFEEVGLYKDEFEIQSEPDLESDYRHLESADIDLDEFEHIENESVIEPTDANATTTVGYDVNFLQVFVDAALDVTTGVDHYGTLEDDLEANVGRLDGNSVGTTGSGSDTSTNRSDVAAQFQGQILDEAYDDRYELEAMKASRETGKLEDDLLEELNSTDEAFTDWYHEDNNSYTVDRVDMLDTDEEPVYGAITHIEDVENEFVYANLSADGPEDTFATPGELATAQVRLAYFDRLYHYIERIADQYQEQVGELEDEVDDLGGSFDMGDDLLGFVQDVLNADVERDPEEIEGSPVLDDAHFEVSGSPTYMTHENVSEDEDPAVRPANATITDFDAETEHVPLTIQSENRLPWPGLPITAVPPTYWFLQSNTWTNTIRGEYARFEVSATVGDPADADRLTYVRERRPVEPELHDGTEVTLGVNEPITFESATEVVVVMPGGVVQTGAVPAVADTEPTAGGQTACSPTWEYTGPDFDPVNDTAPESVCDHPENATAELLE